jgi:serine protein kinase
MSDSPRSMESEVEPGAAPPAASMTARIAAMQDYARYRDLSWEGSFEQYLNLIRERPQVTRNAFQRVYDMVIS